MTTEDKLKEKINSNLVYRNCLNCGHLCSFNEEEFHCYKCEWDWKDEDTQKSSKEGK